MKKIVLVIEKGDKEFWGRVNYGEDLIVENQPTVEALAASMRKLLTEENGPEFESVEFEYQYDLTSLFEAFDVLKIGKVAQRAGINQSLLRQYVSAVKFPSLEQAKKIEKAIHDLAKELLLVSIVEPQS